jgi:hypothetical protein
MNREGREEVQRTSRDIMANSSFFIVFASSRFKMFYFFKDASVLFYNGGMDLEPELGDCYL